MIPKQAIEKAIEGGWHWPHERLEEMQGYSDAEIGFAMWRDTALDPTFWQALGKALGWLTFRCEKCRVEFTASGIISCLHCDKVGHYYSWMSYALDFTREVLDDGDTEKFWNDLLK